MSECPNCSESFSSLGNHWRYNKSHRPTISKYQHEIITGILMGDGSVHYYGDGHYANYSTNNYIRIACLNESENKEKICSMFSDVGLPEPNRWQSGNPAWNVEESRELFDYMGEPVDGFKYKWP